MGKIAEFLAGCPRQENADGIRGIWKSARAFSGIMFSRMYTLFTRPHQALAEFGAGDYRTPFLFFLFFTIIWALLHTIASILWMAVRGFNPATPFTFFPSNTLGILLTDPLLLTLNAMLYLGIAVIILALGLWVITGHRSWNPAFTIGAYCYPVDAVLTLIADFAAIPGQGFDQDPLVGMLRIALTALGIILTVLIAGYGIHALTKIPQGVAFIVIVSWIVVADLVMNAAGVGSIYPLERDLLQVLARSLNPTEFPTAAALGAS